MTIAERVYSVVASIPRGKVTSYHVVARLAKLSSPRLVGRYLHNNPDPKRIPCHRVVHADGSLAPGYAFGGTRKQRDSLLGEGVIFRNPWAKAPKVNLARCLWNPDARSEIP